MKRVYAFTVIMAYRKSLGYCTKKEQVGVTTKPVQIDVFVLVNKPQLYLYLSMGGFTLLYLNVAFIKFYEFGGLEVNSKPRTKNRSWFYETIAKWQNP